MRFAEPWAFLALLLVPLVFIGHALYERRRARRLQRAGDSELIRALTTGTDDDGSSRRQWQTIMLASALALITVALARPQFGLRTEVHKGRGMDVVLALDLSKSMQARDVVPSRLDRARVELKELVSMLPGDRIGLVAFTSVAIPLCPLTVDHSALELQLFAADPNDMPRGGTSLANAIDAAKRMIDTSPNEGGAKAILIITDGEEHIGDAPGQAKAALEEGIEVHVAGVGSRTGEPIPILDGSGNISGYVKDKKGQTVITRLNEAMLKKVATAGGGLTALPGSTGGLDLSAVRDHLGKLKKAELEERTVRVYEERYRWVLGPAFVLLLLASFLSPLGRRIPSVAAMLLIGFLTMGAGPFEREDGDVAEGNTALIDGRAEDAITAYDNAASRLGDDPRVAYNRGLANAAAGELDSAIEDFDRAAARAEDDGLRSQASFAAGNAHRAKKALDEAIASYRRALIANPKNSGARRNLELTRAMKRIQELQPKQENPDGEPSDDDQDRDQDAGPSDGPRGDGGQQQQDDDQQQDGADGGVPDSGTNEEEGEDDQGPPDAGPPPDSGSMGNAGEDGGAPPDTGSGSSGSEEDNPEEPPKEMNEQDVQQLLDALQEREQVLKRKRLREKYGASPVEKDW